MGIRRLETGRRNSELLVSSFQFQSSSFVFCLLIAGFWFPFSSQATPIHVTFVGAAGSASPSRPSGIDQISVGAFDPATNSLRIEASSGAGGTNTPSNADQVFDSIFDAANNAIHVECISGCAGATTETNGVMNGSQSVLDLVAGSNITLTNSGGNVTISASASGGSSSWSGLTSPTGNLSLSMGADSTTLTWTGGNELNWSADGNELWQNTTAATSSANQNSPTLTLGGAVWNGSASVNDLWRIQDQPQTGTNGQSILDLSQSGSTSGYSVVRVDAGINSTTMNTYTNPNITVNQAAGSSNDFVQLWRNGTELFDVSSAGYATQYGLRLNETVALPGASGVDVIWGDSGHVIRTKLNNGSTLDIATQGVNNIAYSTTPALDMSKGNVQQFSCTTAAGSLSPSTANLRPGQIMTFVFIQNGTTACTVSFPSNMHGATSVGTTLGSINTQMFVVSANGTDLYAVDAGVQNMTGGTP
jgi:hypothetical protein